MAEYRNALRTRHRTKKPEDFDVLEAEMISDIFYLDDQDRQVVSGKG
jgi:hypothetical protein